MFGHHPPLLAHAANRPQSRQTLQGLHLIRPATGTNDSQNQVLSYAPLALQFVPSRCKIPPPRTWRGGRNHCLPEQAAKPLTGIARKMARKSLSSTTQNPTKASTLPPLDANDRHLHLETQRLNVRWLRPICVIGFLTASMIALATMPGFRTRDVLLLDWQNGWRDIPADKISSRCQQIAKIGPEGIPVLVEAMCEDRSEVATAAAQTLLWITRDWQSSSCPVADTQNAMHLARQLARHIDRVSPKVADIAAQLSRRLVVWPIDNNHADANQFLVDCDLLLRKTKPVDREAAESNGAQPLVTDRRLEGSDTTLPTSSQSVDASSDEAAPGTPPQRAAAVTSLAPSLEMDSPLSSTAVGNTPKAIRTVPQEADNEPAPLEQVDALSDRELLKQLRDGDLNVQEVVQELERRKFSPIQLSIVKRIVDPDPAARLRLLRDLPHLRIDVRPWLIWLASDSHAQVRSEVATLIGTSSDPDLKGQLETLRQIEDDPEVLRQIQRATRESRSR